MLNRYEGKGDTTSKMGPWSYFSCQYEPGPECDIREHFDTNEYPNIFVSKNLTQTNVRISIRNENCMNIRIFI